MIKTIILLALIFTVTLLYILGIRHANLEVITTFLSEASGAAFGGFLGSFVVWLMRDLYVHFRNRPKHIVTYYVADNLEEIYGKLRHHQGIRVKEPDIIKKTLEKE